jgi:hypothetical protein
LSFHHIYLLFVIIQKLSCALVAADSQGNLCSEKIIILTSTGLCFLSDKQLKAVETKLEERVNSQPSISRGPKLKGAWSTFACIGKGYQVNSEVNAKRQMYERRIQELEIELSNQQYEVSLETHP